MSRGLAYHKKGDEDRAIADLNEAIRLNPGDAAAFSLRARVFSAAGGYDRAIADYSETIRLDPRSTLAYFARGLLYRFAGSAEKALADFDRASALAPKNAYVALWVDIAGRHNNLPSRLAQASSRIDMAVWPAPVIQLFMGQLTPAALLAAADDPDSTRKNEKECDAIFFSGEFSLMKGLNDDAVRLFRQAANDCPRGFSTGRAAGAELKALGAVP
jgi:lipoprotein NlpI